MNSALNTRLTNIFQLLLARFGPQNWWPAETPFEIIIGAILTQSTGWTSVEKAIANLKEAGCLAPSALRATSHDELAIIIRPSGYFNAKSTKLQAFCNWLLDNYADNLKNLLAQDTPELRHQLLSIYGIGEETADSIILYAAYKPVFVIDSYTKKICSRLGIVPKNDSYQAWQKIFMDSLPHDTTIFNEYHALLVRLGKDFCRKKPACESCALNDLCRYANPQKP
ncbi:endonuclease III domain-containing protein [Chloroflexota bacterium]